MRPASIEDIDATWQSFQGQWDWRKRRVLRLPIRREIEQLPAPWDESIKPVPIMAVDFSIERGWLDGQRAWRIVGRIVGTEITKIVEEQIDHQPTTRRMTDARG